MPQKFRSKKLVRQTASGKFKLKFKPPKPNSAKVESIAKSPKKMYQLKNEHQVIKDVIHGKSFETIAQGLGITPTEAFAVAKQAVRRWITDLQIDAPEAKALDLQRLDALLVILWQRAEPNEVIDGATGRMVMVPGDLGAAKLILDVIRMRADIYGYEAAKKMEVDQKIEHLHRLYIGASPDAL